MRKRFEFAVATPEEVVAGAALFEQAFGVAVDPALWRRKYFENPAGTVICFVAKDKGKVVSFASLHPAVFVKASERAVLYQYGDAMTAPSCRGQGLYSALKEISRDWLLKAGVPLTFSFPNADTLTISRKLGYATLGFMTRWVKPVPPFHGKCVDGVDEVALDDERLVAAALIATHAAGTAAVRGKGFFAWRYGDRGRAWLTRDGDAYAITTSSPRGVWIRDLGIAPRRQGAFRFICRALTTFAAARGVRHISYARLGTSYRAELLINGFVPVARGAVVMARVITAAGQDWARQPGWHLTDADRDIDTRRF